MSCVLADELPVEGDPDLLARFQDIFASPAFDLVGGQVLALDGRHGRSHLRFRPGRQLLNPLGTVQGGMLTVMLDSTAAIAAIAKSGVTVFLPTLEIKTSFIAPARPRPLIGIGRCLHLGRSTAFVEGALYDEEGGHLIARASATARPVPIARAMKKAPSPNETAG
ncbi:MAG: PaaI family thioesterase [Alphaproteobacteria bacterium]|nr:MAG: PaaI family thioesterase [Alphaproteobacteria bacterium]